MSMKWLTYVRAGEEMANGGWGWDLGESDIGHLRDAGFLSWFEREQRTHKRIKELKPDVKILCVLANLCRLVENQKSFADEVAVERAERELRHEFERRKAELETRRGKAPASVSAYLTGRLARYDQRNDLVSFAAGTFNWSWVFKKPWDKTTKTRAAWEAWVEAGRHKNKRAKKK